MKKSVSPTSPGPLTAMLPVPFAKDAHDAGASASHGPQALEKPIEALENKNDDLADRRIISDIAANIEATPGDESPVNDDAFSKTGVRSKLSLRDIRIILYLIVTIKPFKYIGDRTLSQTKKWEMIQTKFAELKQQDRGLTKSDPSLPIAIPTVRTLQRQLTSAIKKGKLRAKDLNFKAAGNLPLGDPPVFKSITRDSQIGDFEIASYELFELSESLKSGKIGNASSFDVPIPSDPEPPVPVPAEIPESSSTSTSISSGSISSTSSNPLLASNSKNINLTRASLKKLVSDGNPPALDQNVKTILSLLNQLLKQTEELHKHNNMEILRLFEENNRVIEQNKKFEKEQIEINKALAIDVLNFLKSSDSVAQETIKQFDDLL